MVAMHPFQTEWIELEARDGTRFDAYVARPSDVEKAPPLLVFQEIFGVNDHIQDLVERFAHQGFTAVAPDLFHRTAPRFTTPYTDSKPGRDHAARLTLDGLEGDCLALQAWAASDRRAQGLPMGATGYCMGGRIAFLAHTFLPLACAVTYYGGQIHTFLDRIPLLRGQHLFLWGGADGMIPSEQRDLIQEALQEHKRTYMAVEFGGADHGFFCDQRPTYHPEAAHLAWEMTLRFLKTHLGLLEEE
jgi:carboxymethylenebutenolidase